jgi:DNA-directed RNA polymerase II subunit RPB2
MKRGKTSKKDLFVEPSYTDEDAQISELTRKFFSGGIEGFERERSPGEYYEIITRENDPLKPFLPMKESGKLLRRVISEYPPGYSSVQIYNNWITNTAKIAIESKPLFLVNESDPNHRKHIKFENLSILPPRYTLAGEVLPLTPQLARLNGITYGSDWYVDAVLYDGENVVETKRNICIANIPTMLKSELCVLKDKTKEELALYGEDPDDVSGYFVVSGTEKVIPLQEQLAVNKIFLMDLGKKDGVVVRLTPNTTRGTALIELKLDKSSKSIIKIRLPSMKNANIVTVPGMKKNKKDEEKYKSVDVLRIFRLYGYNEEASINGLISLFLRDDPEKPGVIPKKSLLKLSKNYAKFYIKDDDVAVFSEKTGKLKLSREEQEKEVKRILETDLFPHLNTLPKYDGETEEEALKRKDRAKIELLAIMVAKFLEYLAGFRELDDRDSWSNNRLVSAGVLMEVLFRNAWRKTLGIIQDSIDKKFVKDFLGVTEKLRHSNITDTFHDSFIGTNWGVKGGQMKKNITQILYRDSIVATLAHITTIDVAIPRTDRQQKPRLVQDGQWGFVCFVATPEGENAGIVKLEANTTKLSVGKSDKEIIRFIMGDSVEEKEMYVSALPTKDRDTMVLVNAKPIGWCNGEELKHIIIERRRNDEFPTEMSVILVDKWLYIDLGSSRPIRPVVIVNPDQSIDLFKDNNMGLPISEMFKRGIMENISPWEQEYIKIASTKNKITERLELFKTYKQNVEKAKELHQKVKRNKSGMVIDEFGDTLTLDQVHERLHNAQEKYKTLVEKNKPYTHLEIDPMAVLSIPATFIPWPETNQAPRNTYQVAMSKQSLSEYHSNHNNRFDGKIKILAFPNTPIVETDTYETYGINNRGAGQNVLLSFMAYPFTEEDAFVFKKEFLDRGGFRIIKHITYKTVITYSNEVMEKLEKPVPKPGETVGRYNYIQNKAPGDPLNGLPLIGAPIRSGDCVIGKIQIVNNTGEIRNESIFARIGEEGIVDKVLVTSDNKKKTVTVKLRTMRIPECGDKFAPRNAQKGTIGSIRSEKDLPVTKDGLAPDIITNVHCFVPDTPILCKNGLSKRLIDMKYDGGDDVWTFDKETRKFCFSNTRGWGSEGFSEVMELTLADGRTITCTPNHKIPVLDCINDEEVYKLVRFDEITPTMKFMCGIDGVLDHPTQEERAIELAWKLDCNDRVFSMKTEEDRQNAMAFARILGAILTDGSLSKTANGTYAGNLTTGHEIDMNAMLDDIEMLSGKRPSVYHSNKPDFSGVTQATMLPKEIVNIMVSIDNMTIGRKTSQEKKWPSFLYDEKCPNSILREFLAAMFGGDGWCPYLRTNKQDGQGTVTFCSPAISKSSLIEFKDSLVEKMGDLGTFLERVGVAGSRIDKPKYYTFNGKKFVTVTLQLASGTEFGDRVGFRHCIQKSYRLAPYQSYMRYLENVRRQNDTVIQRAREFFDTKQVGRSLELALEMARKELYKSEKPYNNYYSNATLDQIRNRRRKDRHNNLLKWDYTRIEDAEVYLNKLGVYHWYRTEGGTGGAEYIVHRDSKTCPFYLIDFHDIRPKPSVEVYNIKVNKTSTVLVGGVAVAQSLPSRMTISYLIEMTGAKSAVMRGEHINGGAFQPFHIDEYRKTFEEYGMHPYGYEEMRSGTSGYKLNATISMGIVYFQALRHHVLDKIQARSFGQVKPVSRQPPKGRGNRGGLRFGEMERDASISHGASSFIRERLMLVSDVYRTVFCKTCSSFAVNDATTKWYKTCSMCGGDEFGLCDIPYVYKLLIHYLATPGINLRPEFVNSTEYLQSVLKDGKMVSREDEGSEKSGVGDLEKQLNQIYDELAEESVEDDLLEADDEVEGEYDDYNAID